MSDMNLSQSWGKAVELVHCEFCKWHYLLSEDKLPCDCPHCYRAALASEGSPKFSSLTQFSKLVLDFTVTPETLSERILQFKRGIPFAPTDLEPNQLQTRLQQVYLPLWLVDSQVQATWETEVGFNYDIVTHKDSYHEKRGWSSEQITKTRIEWEKRLGTLARAYNKIATSAFQKPGELKPLLKNYDLTTKQPYTSQVIASGFVCLPTISQNKAWPHAAQVIGQTAIEECQKASRADHIRDFTWQPTYHNRQWTLLLLPLYSSYYFDDEQQRQPVLLHGQSGLISGKRRASMQRAKRFSLLLITIAITIALFSLLAFALSSSTVVLEAAMIGLSAGLLDVAMIGLSIALLVGLLALLPLVIVWYFNRTH